jgi:hypothetical protein
MNRLQCRFLLVTGVITAMASTCLSSCSTSLPAAHVESPQQRNGKFHNVVPRQAFGFKKTL